MDRPRRSMDNPIRRQRALGACHASLRCPVIADAHDPAAHERAPVAERKARNDATWLEAAMTLVDVLVASPEEAVDGVAEFWYGQELVGITVIHDGRLHLRIDPRTDGAPWLIDT